MDDRIERASLLVITAYGVIIKALQALPLPIAIPYTTGTGFDSEIEAALIRAIYLLGDLPLETALKRELTKLLIDYLLVSDLHFQLLEDEQTWKVEAIEMQCKRITERWILIKDSLTP